MTTIFFLNSTFQKHEQIVSIVRWFALKMTSNAIGVQKNNTAESRTHYLRECMYVHSSVGELLRRLRVFITFSVKKIQLP